MLFSEAAMRRIEQWEQSGKARLLAALLLNALFLLGTALLLHIGFESNDDLTLAAFVDGQMAVPTAHIPYVNIALGALLKGIYGLLGRGVAWHAVGQYALLFVSWTAMGFVLNERLGLRRGTLVSALLLLFFAADAYTMISYTKTAAVCTVGGMLLLARTAEREGRERRTAGCVIGVLLCLFGFMLRKMEFLPCLAILSVLCLRRLWGIFFLEEGSAGEKGKRLLRYALPFVCLLLAVAALWAADEAAWSTGRWAPYRRFDAIRVAYSDYGRPSREEMPEVYEALGLTQTDSELLVGGNYFDPETYSGEVMQALAEGRDAAFPRPSAGECLGLFLDKCLRGFFINLPVYGLLLVLLLWLPGGKRGLRDWLALLAAAGIFLLAYLYLIWRGRYLIDRVDLGLLLALTAVLAWLLDRERLRGERGICALTLLLALFAGWFLLRGSLRSREADVSADRAAVETLLADTEHVYLAKLDTVDDRVYPPFEPAGRGYWDRIVLLGGFDCNHPSIMDNLARFGVSNPYRDCVDNGKVYLIEDDIELTLAHIRERYEPLAEAERIEPLSTQTGYAIYRIVKGGGEA